MKDWKSCVFGPATIREPDGSDIKEMFFFDYRTIADLIDNYPDMKNQIEAHFDAGKFEDAKLLPSLEQWSGSLTADDKNTMWDVVNNAWSAKNGASGFAQVVMHLYPIKRKENVWVNIFGRQATACLRNAFKFMFTPTSHSTLVTHAPTCHRGF